MATYAIVETGGKQVRVSEGDTVYVEKLAAAEGEQVRLERVLLVSQDGQVRVGAPTVEGAAVVARVDRHGRGRKVLVFKYKPKKRYRRRYGHRQPFTRLVVEKIEA
ncbi:MAG: 50S ribosomal protein L21 [Firmicutes bacterium]|nr:50S ribosomal protein L21 [Bacillota bacterium]